VIGALMAQEKTHMPDVSVKTVTAALRQGELRIPYWEVDAGTRGPALLLTASLHGNEVQGAEVMRQILPVFSEQLRAGTVVMVPFANLPAVWNRRPHIDSGPETPYGDPNVQNINRTWPGKPDGDDSERITFALHRDVVERATHNIDMHCWPRCRGTTVLLRKGHEGATAMARHTAVRFAQARGSTGPVKERPGPPSTLTGWFIDTGRTAICIETSGQYMVVPKEVRRTVRAVTNCARLLGLLPGEPEGLEEPMVWVEEAEQFKVTAPRAGLFARAELESSDTVEQGQLLGHLISDTDLSLTEIPTPASGHLWSYGCHRSHCDVALPAQHPYASEGDTLAVIVR
jgi:predicted deacylase